MTARILIVDDEEDMLALLKRIISEKTEHKLIAHSNSLEALEDIKDSHFDLVIADLKMPKMDGIALLKEIKRVSPSTEVIIMTAYATIETAVEAIHQGAYDYITKPFKKERILLTIKKVLEWRNLLEENISLKKELGENKKFPEIVGTSPQIKELLKKVEQVAPSSATVLITGESGTGKELVARAIHYHSERKNKKMITINCTAIPEQMIESELFGHVKGAFTGAWKDKQGLVEEADQGTLFLDAIGELSPVMQTKILRLLQYGEYRPVGSLKTKKSDIRFIAATNQDLEELMRKKQFREDLFYRINVIRFEIPPLRERVEDIKILAYHFLKKYSHLNKKKIKGISPEAMNLLISHPWPGNVRELENTIERGVILCMSDYLEVKDIFHESDVKKGDYGSEEFYLQDSYKKAKEKAIKMFHRRYLDYILRKAGGNVSLAAEKAGLQRQYLHRLMKEEGIDGKYYRNHSK